MTLCNHSVFFFKISTQMWDYHWHHRTINVHKIALMLLDTVCLTIVMDDLALRPTLEYSEPRPSLWTERDRVCMNWLSWQQMVGCWPEAAVRQWQWGWKMLMTMYLSSLKERTLPSLRIQLQQVCAFICALLYLSNKFKTMEQTNDYYMKKRGVKVTNPSQIRYLKYFY